MKKTNKDFILSDLNRIYDLLRNLVKSAIYNDFQEVGRFEQDIIFLIKDIKEVLEVSKI